MFLHVYLPDELGAKGKAAGLNFSRLLRGAVTAELRESKGQAVPEVEVRRDGKLIEIVVRLQE